MLERIKKRKSIEEEELVESRSGPSADHLGQPKHRKVTDDAEAESISGPSAENLGQPKLRIATEVAEAESISGSSADNLGQPKKHKDSRRQFEEEMQARVMQQQEQSKRRRRESTDDSKTNSELCHIEGNLQRDQAEIRRGIKGNICKREVNAITNLINARCDVKINKKPKRV